MTIAKDASTPAAVDNTSSTSGTAVTASFSPPANSLIAIVANIGYFNTTATGPTVTCKDSLNNTYTAGPAVYDANFDGSYIFTRYYSSAPGSITVTATRTGQTGQAMFQLVPFVLTGCASSQAGAASQTASNTTSGSTTITASITPATANSWVIVGAAVGTNESSSTVAGVTVADHTFTDSTDGTFGAAGHAVTGASPSAETIGWTVPVTATFALAALEILPAAAVLTVPPLIVTQAVRRAAYY